MSYFRLSLATVAASFCIAGSVVCHANTTQTQPALRQEISDNANLLCAQQIAKLQQLLVRAHNEDQG